MPSLYGFDSSRVCNTSRGADLCYAAGIGRFRDEIFRVSDAKEGMTISDLGQSLQRPEILHHGRKKF
jgi:hypothetical protein